MHALQEQEIEMAENEKNEKRSQRRDADVPEGFDLNVGRELGDGWIVKGAGVEVIGRLVGRFIGNQEDDDGKKQAFYQVRIAKAVKATRKDRESGEKEEVMLEPGQLLNVGEHKALEELAPYTADGGVYDVWFKYIKEENIPNSKRTFWMIKGPRLKTIKPRQHAPITNTQRASGNGRPAMVDDDIPF